MKAQQQAGSGLDRLEKIGGIATGVLALLALTEKAIHGAVWTASRVRDWWGSRSDESSTESESSDEEDDEAETDAKKKKDKKKKKED